MTTNHTPAELTAKANDHRQKAFDSFERCDTDGFLTQWAHNINAAKLDLAAEIAENGGKWEFEVLTDLDGNIIPGKVVDGQYGPVYGLMDRWDGPITGFVNIFAKRESTLTKKGYRRAYGQAAACAGLRGGNYVNVQPVIVQLDLVREVDGFYDYSQ